MKVTRYTLRELTRTLKEIANSPERLDNFKIQQFARSTLARIRKNQGD